MAEKEIPVIARVHYVEFTLPDKFGSRKLRIDIYTETENFISRKITGFVMSTTSYGSLGLRDSGNLAFAMDKAIRRMKELITLYKGKEVMFERDLF